MTWLPDPHVRLVARWCEGRVPDHARDSLRLESKIRGRTVTIFERRPPWDGEPDDEWTSERVAQLRFDPESGNWALLSPARNGRWRPYPDCPAASTPMPLLEELESDPLSVFWG